MGLLRRKAQVPVIGTRNPTGLPSALQKPENALSDASRMAAQAAASLAHTHQQQQQQPVNPPSKPSQPFTSPKLPPPPQRRMSRHIVNSTSSKSLASQKSQKSQKRNSYISTVSTSPVYTRSAATAAADMSLENLSLHDTQENDNKLGTMNLASLAAQSAALASSEFLPPPTNHRAGSYLSSPSSIASSVQSVDSPPFHAKLGGTYRSDNFFSALNRSNSGYSDADQKEFDEFEWANKSSSSLKSSTSSKIAKSSAPISVRGGFGAEDLSQTVINEYDEMYSDSDHPQYEHTLQPPSDEEEFERGNSPNSIDDILVNDIPPEVQAGRIARPAVRRPVPQRKPPPMSPRLGTTEHMLSVPQPPALPPRTLSTSSTLSVPSSLPPRAPSPRRKPPPDFIGSEDTTLASDSMLDSEMDEEVLPQYPMTVEELKRHRKYLRSHGLRKGAKKILKKGFKGSYKPSDFLYDFEAAPHNGVHAPTSCKSVHLKTTMRKEKKDDKFNDDKPWKHHTDIGYVSEQERKRYEGVWVSNKGLYMDRIDPSVLIHDVEVPGQLNTALKASMLSMKAEIGAMEANLMVNVVVRELWSRSRLPNETLQKVWDLVDTRHDGTIDRTSFIVGMWLVDQCLYGRKLPREVPDAVWNSVVHNGLNVVVRKKKK